MGTVIAQFSITSLNTQMLFIFFFLLAISSFRFRMWRLLFMWRRSIFVDYITNHTICTKLLCLSYCWANVCLYVYLCRLSRWYWYTQPVTSSVGRSVFYLPILWQPLCVILCNSINRCVCIMLLSNLCFVFFFHLFTLFQSIERKNTRPIHWP